MSALIKLLCGDDADPDDDLTRLAAAFARKHLDDGPRRASRDERLARKLPILREILAETNDEDEQIRLWMERAEMSVRSFHRAVRMLR